jgi:hypothetical protein
LSVAEENACCLYRAGIPLIAGTDSIGHIAANGLEIDVPWGLTLHYELRHLVNIVCLILAATSQAEKWHRVSNHGQVKVGMIDLASRQRASAKCSRSFSPRNLENRSSVLCASFFSPSPQHSSSSGECQPQG